MQNDCKARNLNKEDVMDRGRWKKLIKIDDDQDRGWVSVSSGHPGSPGQRAIKRLLLLLLLL